MKPVWRRRLRRAADIVIPWGVGLFYVLVALGPEYEQRGSPELLGVLLALAQGVALRWRRSHPELVMGVALAGGLAFWALSPDVVLPLAGLFALYSLAEARPFRVALAGLVALLGVAALNFFTTTAEDSVFALVVVLGAWALGEASRNRRLAVEEGARRAVTEEKAEIARELHDVIAHSVSVIVVQAAAADDVFESRPDQARAALRSIERTGRDTLGELRRLLSAARPDEGEEATSPQPGLDRLEELADGLRSAGLTVDVRRDGTAATALPAGVDLSAYRIVQEALTNTLRHAHATRAR